MVTSSFLPGRGGIETYLAELCDELAPRVAVLAAGSRDGRPLPRDLGYPADAGPGRMLAPGPRVARAAHDAAARHGTDRILFGTPWPLALLGPRLARAGLRYAAIVHGAELLVPAAVPGVRRALARALAGAELLLPVSDFTAGRVERLLRAQKLSVPPLDVLRARVDVDRFSPDAPAARARAAYGLGDRPVVLALGRLVRRKGVDRLVDALPEVRARVPGAALVVAGTGPQERALRRRAAGVEGVVFAGRVPDADAPALYAAADVFALPVADRWFGLEVEGLGIVLLEAQACGTPCVTGRSGGTPEAVLDGVTGHVVDATDRSALAARLADLLADPERARTFGRAGREHVAAAFARRPLPARLLDWLDGDPVR